VQLSPLTAPGDSLRLAYFASGGADGCVRLFDTRSIERRITERARLVHHCGGGTYAIARDWCWSVADVFACSGGAAGDVPTSIRSMCVVDGGSSLAVATDAGAVLTLAVDQQSNATGTMQKLSGKTMCMCVIVCVRSCTSR
jgi:hypothetical protein